MNQIQMLATDLIETRELAKKRKEEGPPGGRYSRYAYDQDMAFIAGKMTSALELLKNFKDPFDSRDVFSMREPPRRKAPAAEKEEIYDMAGKIAREVVGQEKQEVLARYKPTKDPTARAYVEAAREDSDLKLALAEMGANDPESHLYKTALRIAIGKTEDLSVPLCMHYAIVGRELKGKGFICRVCGTPVPQKDQRIDDHEIFQREDLPMPICKTCARDRPDAFHQRYQQGVDFLEMMGYGKNGLFKSASLEDMQEKIRKGNEARYAKEQAGEELDDNHCRVCGLEIWRKGDCQSYPVYNDHLMNPELPGPICQDCKDDENHGRPPKTGSRRGIYYKELKQ